ncbi:alpha-ketoglutarate-dependent dioxygenase AlkB family protein [Novilysobacter spongiicola]|uniref:Alkylated DNA repair dioxygenase AlkB n=1 Tax=Lysobacter spongiicola DSM 21749 TaxID=1122188 RepID=A0A1T4LM71_9GAMM|nr:alpha-ketoglutarate-dependent dioxygenase AlkB [Lysobacter spongiicola]SJZ55726.1 Alkylated DNA repair dioxygenase AlkB [Lysobacter spongiicola DSM 21749]
MCAASIPPVAPAQAGLFDTGPLSLLHDAEGGVSYHPGLIDRPVADQWFDWLREHVPWKAQQRPMYDRVVDVPRLVASWHLEDGGLPDCLRDAGALLRDSLAVPFNSVGLNYYRDGRDSVAPHNDKLHSLVAGHPIALLSLGSVRRMTIRSKQSGHRGIHIDLEPGSLLLMSHQSQLHYEHGVPKTREPVGPRISLAFRVRPPAAG